MKTKVMGIAVLSAVALLGSAVAQAELPWTYVEGGYTKFNGDESADTTAWDVLGSIGFAGMWHASLDYQDGTTDFSPGSDQDFDGYTVTVGAHPALTANTQLVADLTYFDFNDDSGDFDGYGAGFGIRHAVTDRFELGAEAFYTQTSEDGNSDDVYDTSVVANGRYNWTSNFSTGLTVPLTGGSSSGARFDVRWSFGGDVF